KLAAGDGDWSAFTESTDSLQAIANAIESAEDIADAVWDEVLTGATHNIANSAGRRLREIGGFAIRQDTAQDGDTQTITLDAGASSTDDIYVGDLAV
ncbi:MAG: hypothetical protein GWN00_04010, partial [Aliifodinibius sp.]|nr:hypothetical protein [Fodinibius sp.]NIW98554.1 hypothetical protein [Phycisphaerae bacterium]NIY23999.1 hypothetical protein [Fodinibius sp.]